MPGRALTAWQPSAVAPAISVPLPPRAIAACALAVAACAGALLAFDVTLGLGLVAATIFVPLALTNLPLAMALWVPLIAIEYSQIAGPAVFGSTLVIVAAAIGTHLRRTHLAPSPGAARRWVRPLGAFVLWIALSAVWARDFAVTFENLRAYVVAAAVLATVATTLTRPRHIALVGLMFVAGSVLSVIVGLVGIGGAVSTTANAIDTATQRRLSGGAGDPNYLAAMLVPAIAIALALLRWYRNPATRLALVASVLVMVYGFVLTESRGGFLAALVALVLAVVLARGVAVIATALAVLTVTGAFFAASPDALARVTTYDGGGAGRSDLWTVAWRMVEDHPVQGVGLGNFVVRSREYALERPGTLEFSELIVDKPYVAHNVYLQTLAEVGVVGLMLLLAVVAACLSAGLAAVRRFESRGEPAMVALAQAIVVGTTGALTASFFISNTTDKRLFALLALGPALLLAAARPAGTAQLADSTSR